MFERIDYTVVRIAGDYAYLQQTDDPAAEEKCVAMALLPPAVMEGSLVKYEMMEYELL